MNVLIFGPRGYLAEYFLRVYPDAVRSEADISNPDHVGKELDLHKPDVVINCAGRTGRPNVDWCEDHKVETLRSNVTGPLVILDECAKRDIYWVQVGSGCIYDGDNGGKGYSEDDEPNYFGSYYSLTKLWIDRILKDFPVLTLRLRMPFDGSTHQRNLITKISKYDRILDTDNSLTYLPDLMHAAERLISKRATGLYNIVNPGVTSPYKIMKKYVEIVDPTKEFTLLDMKDLGDVAKAGRSNCMLSTTKLLAQGIELPHVDQRIEEALTHIRNAKAVELEHAGERV